MSILKELFLHFNKAKTNAKECLLESSHRVVERLFDLALDDVATGRTPGTVSVQLALSLSPDLQLAITTKFSDEDSSTLAPLDLSGRSKSTVQVKVDNDEEALSESMQHINLTNPAVVVSAAESLDLDEISMHLEIDLCNQEMSNEPEGSYRNCLPNVDVSQMIPLTVKEEPTIDAEKIHSAALKRMADEQMASSAKKCKTEMDTQILVELPSEAKATHEAIDLNGAKQIDHQIDARLKSNQVKYESHSACTSDKGNLYKVIKVCCSICSWSSSHPERLNAHMKQKHQMLLYQCFADVHCNERFNSQNSLKHHYQNAHPNVHQFFCRQCLIKCASSEDAAKHMFKYHNKGQFECTQCNYRSDYRGSITDHIYSKHHRNGLANVNASKFSFAEKSYMYIIRWMKCSQEGCEEFFLNPEEYKKHLSNEHNHYTKHCPYNKCSRSFDDIPQLSRHVKRSHENVSKWKCYKCKVHFGRYEGLYEHQMQYHHEGLFQCSVPECQKMYKYISEVIAHFVIHH